MFDYWHVFLSTIIIDSNTPLIDNFSGKVIFLSLVFTRHHIQAVWNRYREMKVMFLNNMVSKLYLILVNQ